MKRAAEVGELTFLRKWREEIQSKIKLRSTDAAVETSSEIAAKPVDRAAELRAQIELAIVEERFEDAAVLRDELKRLNADRSGTTDPAVHPVEATASTSLDARR